MTINRERMMVPREKCGVDFEYDTLDAVLAQVEQLIKDYGKDAKIMMRCSEYSDSDKEYMYLYIDGAETDDEMTKRISNAEKWEKDRQVSDRENYERLQKIYGDKK